MFSAGASCVRWSKFDQNTLASSHDGNIRVWDIRVSLLITILPIF